MSTLQTVGILGAGKVGSAIGRLAVAAGYDTMIATAKDPAEISLLTEIMVPGARAVWDSEAMDADLVIVAIPLRKYTDLDADALTGKIVIDAMNYWAPTDGTLDAFENEELSSSEVVAKHLAGSRVVRTLNHIGYHDMDEQHHTGRALAVAADDDEAKRLVMDFIDSIGFVAVDAGSLNDARRFSNGTDIFNGAHTESEMRALLRKVTV